MFVLGCHEVENLFLFPPVLNRIDQAVGAEGAIQSVADSMAGLWILRRAFARGEFRGAYLVANRDIRRAAGETNWSTIEQDSTQISTRWAQLQTNLTNQESAGLEAAISEAIEAYRSARQSTDLWKLCMGKEVLKQMPHRYGFTRPHRLEREIRTSWRSEDALLPDELTQLREYIRGLAPTNPASLP